MTPARWVMAGAVAAVLVTSGAVVAGGRQDPPAQDAQPVADPIAEALRDDPGQEAAPAGDPAPAVPIAITPPTPAVETSRLAVDEASADEDEDAAADKDKDEGESDEDKAKRLAADTPTPRQRRRVAIVEAPSVLGLKPNGVERLPDGLTPEELSTVLRIAGGSGRAIGLEVTIYNPALDRDGSAGRVLAAAIVHGLI